ncbi:putative oxidoreductase YkvO [Reticulibacter mediterranei]|uniref:Putative oxidoreductase YkvO n=1 Tax=Reticulibacter mediterranei TaxID=2778369 RepID=A0A8J3N0L7_9CHLR|nr:SDR family oxidoreductase [Reticulibacter mediterranei]GHO90407.1 putative oxidoreductase YkvO [Reticulibacter mediterranei]
MKRFEGKVAVVTGGTSGIGLATAKRLHEEGARLAIVGRNAQKLEEAARTIGNRVLAVQADVAKLSNIDQMYRTITQELGRIDVLFVNAGMGKFAALIDTSESLYDELFAINTKGAYFTLTKAIPSLNDGASIILIALAPINPPWRRPGTSAYSAAKAALRAVAQTAAVELAERRIRVNVVSPGPILTPIYQKAGLSPERMQERLDRMSAAVPLSRLGKPEEVASVVAFLASSDASYITGEEIHIDGGLG